MTPNQLISEYQKYLKTESLGIEKDTFLKHFYVLFNFNYQTSLKTILKREGENVYSIIPNLVVTEDVPLVTSQVTSGKFLMLSYKEKLLGIYEQKLEFHTDYFCTLVEYYTFLSKQLGIPEQTLVKNSKLFLKNLKEYSITQGVDVKNLDKNKKGYKTTKLFGIKIKKL